MGLVLNKVKAARRRPNSSYRKKGPTNATIFFLFHVFVPAFSLTVVNLWLLIVKLVIALTVNRHVLFMSNDVGQ